MGPGAAVPPIESLKRMMPAQHLWPIDEFWTFHAGGDEFKDLRLFSEALEGRYGKAVSAEDYARKAQALAYEGQRAMFEAFGRNKYTATGVIQWMLNNAWPSMIWHLYDYYLRPAGGYFGTKRACEPLHVQYSYDDRSIVVVNDLPQAQSGLKLDARVYDLTLAQRFAREERVDVAADGVQRVFVIPPPDGLSKTYFLRLRLDDASGRTLSSNFYWLSTEEDVIDFKDESKWWYTPVLRHADLTALADLPATGLQLEARAEASGPEPRARVSVANTGQALAFQVRLKLLDGSGSEILPVYWQDNYFELFPGETRELSVALPAEAGAGSLRVEAEAWNAPVVAKELGPA
jgi:exo-1,4-beta-D-glucosaminidase